MRSSTSGLMTGDRISLFTYSWLPETRAKAVIQIAHGVGEHAGRYGRLAEALTGAGYAVYANDHRGHGRTALGPEDLGFFAEHDGWRKCLGDLWQFNRHIAAIHPGVPIVLIGHSMGSFMTQQFMSEHGDTLAGVVLSGSAGRPTSSAAIVRFLARIERLRLGKRGKSLLIKRLTFGRFNKAFEPTRTRFDWLSRDQSEVTKYIMDPLCAFDVSVQLSIEVLAAINDVTSASRRAHIPRDLPIHVIAGSRDPVSDGTTSLTQLVAAYRAAGLARVTNRFYPDARHELFNEINRDDVTRDVLRWLSSVVHDATCSQARRATQPRARQWA